MKVEVIICDRCGERVGDRSTTLRMEQGDWRIVRDLCTACKEIILRESRGVKAPKPKDGPSRLERDLSDRLARVRETAARGIEEWAEGANPDRLKNVLTDIASGARR